MADPPRHAQRILIKKSLLPLALGGFGIGMTEFVIMGILPDIAGGLQISIPQAGYLITAYALGVVVGAPTLVSLMAHRPPRSVLIWFMLMFTLFNAMSAFAPNFEVMMLSRFMAGLPHGAFFGVGAVVAIFLADNTVIGAMFCQQCPYRGFGGTVGDGNRREIFLGFDQERPPEIGPDRRACGIGERLRQRDIIMGQGCDHLAQIAAGTRRANRYAVDMMFIRPGGEI